MHLRETIPASTTNLDCNTALGTYIAPRSSHDGVLFLSVRSNGSKEMGVQGNRCTVQPAVPSCGTPVRGRLRFVVAELGSVWRELRDRRRRPARTPSGGVR